MDNSCNRKQQLEEICLGMGTHIKVCKISIYSSVMTETHSQEACVTMGSLIQDTEKWQPALLTDWLDLFAKNLVTGNLQPLHICFFLSFCSGLEASQPCYVTTSTAVFKPTAAAKFWRSGVKNTLNAAARSHGWCPLAQKST